MFTEPVLVQKLNNQMRYLNERQALLSQNIANIDTPGYHGQDLKKIDFNDMVRSSGTHVELRTTSAKHINASLGSSHFDTTFKRVTSEKKPPGNNIMLEEQMGKISDVGAQHQLASNLLHKYHQLYRAAINAKGQ